MGETAYGQIAGLLTSGRVAPGERLSLRDLAERLGTSTMPIRAAVGRLAEYGALEVSPNRAVRVPVMSALQFSELTDLRQEMEGLAAERAAMAATPADISAIARIEGSFAAAVRRKNPDGGRAVALNRDLHFAIYAAARMPLLQSIIERLWLLAGPVLNLDMRADPRRLANSPAPRFHAAALAALRAHDGAAARAAIAGDIAEAAAFIQARGILKEE
ncbi:GntR family transcriptional regulator [Humitalea rosea]|uniref:GntR family transcriptional regulator n=1 Tax=Humitalea rosea TaxID=990373 RepID=A0A2W7IMF5_9PROT|nr:GntR family transcriptional regulator [Humitalea rosea]PZW48350.1 GntR family transcriptional regulator [Humitalea rosea]